MRALALTADEERFLPWKTVANENDKPQFDWQLKTVVQGFLTVNYCSITSAILSCLRTTANG